MGLEAATYIASLNASNPVGSTDAKSQGDDHLRLIKSTVKNSFPGVDKATYLHQARADVASATITADLPAATSDFLRITGTTAITALGTMAAGHQKNLTFAAALTLTYNVTALIIPGAANITTAAGDTCTAISLGSGNWVITAYQKATGKAVIPPAMSEISSLFNSLLNSFVGVVFEWPGTLATVPAGFLPCDGRAISRTTYSALFALWGTTYGVGDASSTFNIVDDRGRVVAGMDNMGTVAGAANRVTDTDADTLGGTDGTETHTLLQTELPDITLTSSNAPIFTLNGNATGSSGATKIVSGNTSTVSTPLGGDDTPFDVMQPTIFRHKIVWTGVV